MRRFPGRHSVAGVTMQFVQNRSPAQLAGQRLFSVWSRAVSTATETHNFVNATEAASAPSAELNQKRNDPMTSEMVRFIDFRQLLQQRKRQADTLQPVESRLSITT
jgi:hypothetical protein